MPGTTRYRDQITTHRHPGQTNQRHLPTGTKLSGGSPRERVVAVRRTPLHELRQRYREGQVRRLKGPPGVCGGGPFFWWCVVGLCSAVSYSPTPWRVQYHRRWRA
jgi:hypothetical protein